MSDNLRTCKKCFINRKIYEFPIAKKMSDGKIYYRHTCKLCKKQYFDKYNPAYYAANRFKIISANQKNYRENKENQVYMEKRRKYAKNYFENNRQKLSTKAKNDSSNRRKSKTYVLRSNVSRTIRRVLLNHGGAKNGKSVLQFLGYSVEQLKTHLESLFEPWMTWDNYGSYSKNWADDDIATWTWQIDHIIPQSILPYNTMDHPNFRKSWALSNLRPYSSKQNLRDGNRRKETECLST